MSREGTMEGGCDENSPIDDDLHIRTCRAVPGSSSLLVACDEPLKVFRKIIYLEGRRIYVGSRHPGCDMCRLLLLGQTLKLVGSRRAGCFALFRHSPMAKDKKSLPSFPCGQSSSLQPLANMVLQTMNIRLVRADGRLHVSCLQNVFTLTRLVADAVVSPLAYAESNGSCMCL